MLANVNPECERMIRSGQLAARAGVSKDTLRHYERVGVLEPPTRTDSGYRQYPESALRRVLVTRAALSIGISLRDLAEMFSMRDSGQPPCEEVRKLASKRLDSVVAQIQTLTVLRDQLTALLGDWDARLKGRAPGEFSYLLESLVPRSTHEGN